MLNHIDLNQLLACVPCRTTGTTDEFEIPAGKELKIESSPGGDQMSLGIVPEGKMWRVHFVVYVEEVSV